MKVLLLQGFRKPYYHFELRISSNIACRIISKRHRESPIFVVRQSMPAAKIIRAKIPARNLRSIYKPGQSIDNSRRGPYLDLRRRIEPQYVAGPG
jgi:hypothetical protein